MSIFPTKVVLAIDGSEEASRAAEAAVELCEKTGSELHVVHVGEDFYLTAVTDLDMVAQTRVAQEDAESVDLAEEIEAGLVVLGSRGLGGVKRALMGSVSYSVVRHAHCPVLVVRRQDSAT